MAKTSSIKTETAISRSDIEQAAGDIKEFIGHLAEHATAGTMSGVDHWFEAIEDKMRVIDEWRSRGRKKTCPSCHGSGRSPRLMARCTPCRGTGKVFLIHSSR